MVNPQDQSIAALLTNPGRLAFGCWEFGVSWLVTRRWSSLLFFAPPLIVVLVILVTSTIGNFSVNERLLLSYWEKIEEELGSEALEIGENNGNDQTTSDDKQSDDNNADDIGTKSNRSDRENTGADGGTAKDRNKELSNSRELSDYGDLLLQRVLQLDRSNLRATYWVARQLGIQGRLGQSRWMMRTIADDKLGGFAPAHAWLAQDHIIQYRQGVVPLDEAQLMRDLEVATRWVDVHPLLMTTYAELLLKVGRIGDSLRVFEAVTKREPSLRLQFASFAKAIKNPSGSPNPLGEKAFAELAQQLRSEIEPKLANNTVQPMEVLALAQLALLENNWEKAIEFAERSFRMAEPTPFTRRVLSDAYLAKYLATVDLASRTFDLITLDAALKADGSNQRVTEEVARLISLGETASPELTAVLQEKLASGQANAITHLFIGNQKMMNDQLQEAVGHFEVALRLAPTSPVVLNNYALASTRLKPNDPEVLKRAETHMQNALRMAEPKLRAELLDSFGEIRATAQDAPGAIACYEESIRLDADRIKTRRKLIDAYRSAGMESMAVAQEQILAQPF